MDKKVPEIRFKEFTDEWTNTPLREVSFKVTDKNMSKEYRIVLTNSAELGIIDQREYFDRNIANDNSISGYYVVYPNDYVYNPRISTTAPVGPVNRNKLEYVGIMSPLYYIFRIKGGDIDLQYLDYFFKSSIWHDFMYKNGNSGARSDRFSISDATFSLLPIAHPVSTLEQAKIGKMLTLIDKLIDKLEQKLEKLRNIKQALLNQMFINVNRGGYDAPLLRFVRYNEPWIMKQLGIIANKHFISNESVHHQNLLSLSYGKIKRKNIKSDKGLLPASFDTYQILKDGVIVMRFTDLQNDKKSLRVGLATEEGIISPAYTCIVPKDKVGISSSFLYQQLNFYDVVLKLFYQMGDGLRQTLSYEDIRFMYMFLPTISEQRDIDKFYTNFEDCIGRQEIKLLKLKNAKRALLHKMFV